MSAESAPVSLQSHCRAFYSNLTHNCHTASLAALFISLQKDVNKTNEWINAQIMCLCNINNVWNRSCFLTEVLHSGFFPTLVTGSFILFSECFSLHLSKGNVSWPMLGVYSTSYWWGGKKESSLIHLDFSSMKTAQYIVSTDPSPFIQNLQYDDPP